VEGLSFSKIRCEFCEDRTIGVPSLPAKTNSIIAPVFLHVWIIFLAGSHQRLGGAFPFGGKRSFAFGSWHQENCLFLSLGRVAQLHSPNLPTQSCCELGWQ
jgi:hypothetical protein